MMHDNQKQLMNQIHAMIKMVRRRCWRQRFMRWTGIMWSYTFVILIVIAILALWGSGYYIMYAIFPCEEDYFVYLPVFIWKESPFIFLICLLILLFLSFLPWLIGAIAAYPWDVENIEFAREIDRTNNLNDSFCNAFTQFQNGHSKLDEDQIHAIDERLGSQESRRAMCQNTYTEAPVKHKKIVWILGTAALLSYILPFFFIHIVKIVPVKEYCSMSKYEYYQMMREREKHVQELDKANEMKTESEEVNVDLQQQ